MRTSELAFASLLLLLLAAGAHGIRLDRQLHEAISRKLEKGDSEVGQGKPSIADHSVKNHCTPDGQCSGTTEQMTPTVVVKDREVTIRKVKSPLPHTGTGATEHQSSTMNGHATTVAAEATPSQGRHDAEATSPGSPAAAATTRVPRQRQTTYPDILDDIAGMDYSPATRRSPIHN
ncbi:hypothetical protein ACP70R_010423 [Stipagrostis hirtigluma subsp. patula]